MEYDKDIAISTTAMPSAKHGKTNGYIRHSEVSTEPNIRIQSSPRRSFVEKLGMYNISVLVIGTVASFLAMGFLALLWSGSETARHGQPTPVLWFSIVETPNWATRVVTIGSVLVRFATAAQMGVFAALVAAWTLETSGASAEHLPLLSIIRTVNNGPQSHIWNVLHSVRIGSRRLYSAVIILAILDALALQFTSTLLVTDFDTAKIVPGAVNQSIAYGLYTGDDPDAVDSVANLEIGKGLDFNLAAPSTYPRFAEFTDPDSSHMGMDYADTGETLRALLPFGLPDARAILRDYKGPATVFDSRVKCARPSISITNVTFLLQSATNMPYEIIILGNITLEATVPGITVNVTEESDAGAFMSTAVARIYANTTDWRLSYGVVNVGDLWAQDNPLRPGMNMSNINSFLLLNVTGDDWASVLESTNSTTGIVGPYNWTQQAAGIWSDLKTTNDTIDIGISATVCIASTASSNLLIHASSEQDFAEPRNMTWNRGLWKYETEVVRKMLGATEQRYPLHERGILSLQQPANWTDTTVNGTSIFFPQAIFESLTKLENPEITTTYYPDFDWRGIFPQSAVLTPYSQYNSVNRAHAALFQDIIQTTNNPALAMQAMFTTLMQMSYYSALPFFFVEGPASVATSRSITIPVQWTCFGVVMGLLVIHAILVLTAVVLFLGKTDHSLLGNAWQAVAQVSSSDTLHTMHHASNMTDLEVKRLLRMNTYEGNEVILKAGADTGRSQAVYRRRVGENC